MLLVLDCGLDGGRSKDADERGLPICLHARGLRRSTALTAAPAVAHAPATAHATDPAVAAAAAAAKKLPPTLHEALNELEASEALAAGLGSPFMEAYLKLKRAHWAEYTAQLTPWELQTYLDA